MNIDINKLSRFDRNKIPEVLGKIKLIQERYKYLHTFLVLTFFVFLLIAIISYSSMSWEGVVLIIILPEYIANTVLGVILDLQLNKIFKEFNSAENDNVSNSLSS
jgi:uncharacterized membrane protein